MQILYTTHSFPNFDGTSLFIKGLSESLNKLGHRSIIITSDIEADIKIKSTNNYKIYNIPYNFFKFFYNSGKFPHLNFLNSILRKIEYKEPKIIFKIHNYAKKFSPILWGLFSDPLGWKLLLELLKLNLKHIDLIFTTPIPRSCISATLIAAKLKRIPVVIKPSIHYKTKIIAKNFSQWREILNKFDFIIPSTLSEFQILSKMGVNRNKQKVIGVGIPFKKINTAGNGNWREKLKIPENVFTVLYLNTAINNRLKGIDTVIKSAIKLPSIHFVFIGRSKEDWEVLKEKYRLSDMTNISYLEMISDEEKYQLMNAIDLVVRPSLNESFGLIYFEGMSAGKPIITSNIEAMLEVSENVGISIRFNDDKELCAAIKRLKEDRALYKKLSANALKKSEKYGWENIAKEYESLFKELTIKTKNKKKE